MNSLADLSNVNRDELDSALDKLIDWLVSHKAVRQAQLLRYLATEELEGRGKAIKAYTIALDVFGRTDDFDPQKNSLVRVEMRRLRLSLERYYEARPEDNSLIFEIPKGSYRLRAVEPGFTEVGDGRPSSKSGILEYVKTTYNKMRLGIIHYKYQQNRRVYFTSLISLTVIFASFVAIFANLYSNKSDNKCISETPNIKINQNINDRESKLLHNLVNDQILSYDVARLSGSGKNLCDGAPRYSLELEINKSANSVTAKLFEIDSGEISWMNTYNFNDDLGYQELPIRLAALIAYDIVGPDGSLPRTALQKHWKNSRAKNEYACLVNSQKLQFFVGSFDEVKKSHNCLMEFIKDSQSVGTLTRFASADAYLNKNVYNYKYRHYSSDALDAMARARSINPDHPRIFLLDILDQRVAHPQNKEKLVSIIARAKRLYPYNANLLYYIADTCSAYIDEFECGRENSKLSQEIVSNPEDYIIPQIYADFGQGRWESLAQFKSKIFPEFYVEDALMEWRIAGYTENTAQRRREVIQFLRRDGLDNPASLIMKINTFEYSPLIKARFMQVVSEIYPAPAASLPPSAN